MSVYASQIGLLWSAVESYGIDPRRIIPADVYRPGKGPLTVARLHALERDLARSLGIRWVHIENHTRRGKPCTPPTSVRWATPGWPVLRCVWPSRPPSAITAC